MAVRIDLWEALDDDSKIMNRYYYFHNGADEDCRERMSVYHSNLTKWTKDDENDNLQELLKREREKNEKLSNMRRNSKK